MFGVHVGTVPMYSDGSKSGDRVSWAADSCALEACSPLLGSALVFKAELTYILRSVEQGVFLLGARSHWNGGK